MTYTFRNANEQEKEAYRNHLLEQGEAEEDVVRTTEVAHIGVLEGYQGTTPSYRGRVLIVIHQNVSMFEVYTFDQSGNLKRVQPEP